MLKALLFDLDNTLLGNSMDTFMEPYFELVSGHVADLMAPRAFIAALMTGTRAVIANADPELTNEEAFWQAFESDTGRSRHEFIPALDEFYKTRFSELQSLTEQRSVAPQVVQFALDAGYHVVVATNPLFPRVAIEQRLAWAGVPVDEHDFALVTTFENMHAAKPATAYYTEIVERLGIKPWEALMIGDDWDNDIAPADRMKLHTYWVAPDDVPAPAPLQATSRGTLDKFYECCRSGWLASFG
jgi:HAD superfamily hydrolase (TIGR01549 family)